MEALQKIRKVKEKVSNYIGSGEHFRKGFNLVNNGAAVTYGVVQKEIDFNDYFDYVMNKREGSSDLTLKLLDSERNFRETIPSIESILGMSGCFLAFIKNYSKVCKTEDYFAPFNRAICMCD